MCQELWMAAANLPIAARRLAIASALIPAILAAGAAAAARDTPVDSLVLLHTNDTHSWLMPFDRDDGSLVGGAAARAALIDRERVRSPGALLLDAGDVFQGTPFFNFFRGLPDYRAMTAMDYDVGALGNHDLDDGPTGWLRARPEARFELLCANVFVAAESAWSNGGGEVPAEYRRGARWVGGERVPGEAPLRYLAPPYVLRTTPSGRRIAIFGLMTKDLVGIVSIPANRGVAVGDPVAVARRLVPELRKRADVVIALTHMGVEADRALAARVAGIDVIIGGHSHSVLTRPILVPNGLNDNGWHGTAVAQAGSRGRYLGRTVIYFDGKRATRVSGALLPVRPAEGEDSRVAEILRPYRDSIAVDMSRPVFRSKARVPQTGLRDGETPLGDFVADAIRAATDADIGFINAGAIRAALPAGAVTVGDLYEALPFDDQVVVVTMPGWQVRELFDISASRLGKGGFAQISGARFVIARNRAAYVRVGGEILDSNRDYRVATADYLYNGGDGYKIFARAEHVEETGLFLRDAAIRFLRENPDYEFRKDGRIVWEGSTPALRGMGRR